MLGTILIVILLLASSERYPGGHTAELGLCPDRWYRDHSCGGCYSASSSAGSEYERRRTFSGAAASAGARFLPRVSISSYS